MNEVTMIYEVVGKLPDGAIFQVQRKVVCQNNKEADEKINDWNRIAKLTKEIEYSYRRLT